MKLEVLKYIRKGKKINQTKFAEILQVSQTYLSLLEANKSTPSLTLLEDWCNELDCELRIIPKT